MILLLSVIVLTVSLAILFDWYGAAVSVCFAAAAVLYGLRAVKYEKKYAIKTFQEILALLEQKIPIIWLDKEKNSGN